MTTVPLPSWITDTQLLIAIDRALWFVESIDVNNMHKDTLDAAWDFAIGNMYSTNLLTAK